jgi:hypothetical protein
VQQKRGAVRQQRVALHLTEANAATQLTALDGLMRELVDGADGSHLELIRHHMAKPLVGAVYQGGQPRGWVSRCSHHAHTALTYRSQGVRWHGERTAGRALKGWAECSHHPLCSRIAYLVVHATHEDLTRHLRTRDAADEHLRTSSPPQTPVTPQLLH